MSKRPFGWQNRPPLHGLRVTVGYQSKKHVSTSPYVRQRIVRTEHKCATSPESHGGRFVFEAVDFKPSREGLRAAGAPPCAPQAKFLGDKGSREGFGAETLPGGFVWYLMAQTVNPPGRACVSAGYHPTIYLSANPPDRVFGANRKTGGFLCVRRLSPNHRLKRKPCRQGFWRKL